MSGLGPATQPPFPISGLRLCEETHLNMPRTAGSEHKQLGTASPSVNGRRLDVLLFIFRLQVSGFKLCIDRVGGGRGRLRNRLTLSPIQVKPESKRIENVNDMQTNSGV